MTAAGVLVVGSYNQDYVWRVERVPVAGETLRGRDFSATAGGKGFNQAVACVRQGVPTRFIAAVGDDAAGREAQRLAKREGLDARWQVQGDTATGSACIVVDADGQNRIIVTLGANERLDADFVRAEGEQFRDATVVLVQMENAIDTIRAALAVGRARGLVCVLNPAPVHPDLDTGTLARCDVLTPNETEFAALVLRFTGEAIDAGALQAMADAELHRLARALGVATVVITLGANGSFVSHADPGLRGDTEFCYRMPSELVNAIDTTGAGDAFSGALCAALARVPHAAFRDAVRHAHRVAALSTERVGASAAMPRFDEVVARFGAA